MSDRPSPENSEVAVTLASGTSRLKGSRLKWLTAISVGLILAVGAFFWWRSDTPTTQPHYKTEPILRGDLVVKVTATGNLAPVNQVEVGSELSGIVKSVEVDYNDHVRSGQVLARLDTSKLDAQVLQSRAALEAARAKVQQIKVTLAEAARNLERLQSLRELSGGKAISQQDLEAAQATLDRARADLASAEAVVSQTEAALKAYETDLAKTEITSPIDGIVLSRSVDPGQTVAASLQAPVLFLLAEDLAKMELHVDVDEADVGRVRKGQEASFTVDAYPNRTFPARISQVRYGSKTVDGVVTYETLLAVDNSELSLRPGMTATASITVLEKHDIVLAPNAALRFTPPAEPEKDAESVRTGGSVLSRLFPRPRRDSRDRKRVSRSDQGQSRQLWVVRNGQLSPAPVIVGATNGIFTEINATDLKVGQEVVVDFVRSQK